MTRWTIFRAAGLAMFLLSACAAATEAGPSNDCAPLSGLAPVLARPELKYLLVGEVHGTREAPQLFADIVCSATKSGRTVSVAVEDTDDEQPSLDAFLKSDGGTAAQKAFLDPVFWGDEMQDGRTSAAYFALHLYLRQLFAADRILSVTAVQPVESDTGDYEKAMADNIRAAQARNAVVIVLLGNIHARKTVMHLGPSDIIPAGSYLDAAGTVALQVVDLGGEAWTCTSPADCKAHPIGPTASPGTSRGVVFRASADRAFDGTASTGVTATASAPALPLSK
jgi:hypothetical protein